MIEFYPQIRSIHIALALCSGLLFALRGACVIAGMRWPRHPLVRWSSYLIDTALLTAALMLLAILPGTVFANGWLTAKLALLVLYIGLGVCAIRRSLGNRWRLPAYLAALATFALVYTIARAHHPLGVLRQFLG
ncbi:SirB2 family protein [Marilutibacter maris]|uniref:Regulator SirB n=1 Tax=Marilutibacter maris TaxID=1605891 RepID=A0A2U9TDT3_9GAMM|nr:SirB2 family protein [Lysobacter maris]AWV06380.1 hypothetical protein C9I47_0658 [Lysobacter maris]